MDCAPLSPAVLCTLANRIVLCELSDIARRTCRQAMPYRLLS